MLQYLCAHLMHVANTYGCSNVRDPHSRPPARTTVAQTAVRLTDVHTHFLHGDKHTSVDDFFFLWLRTFVDNPLSGDLQFAPYALLCLVRVLPRQALQTPSWPPLQVSLYNLACYLWVLTAR